MYLRTESELGNTLGMGPGAGPVLRKVGEFLLGKALGELFKSPEGGFVSQSNRVSLYREGHPTTRNCIVEFPLTVRLPLLAPFGLTFSVPPAKMPKQNFWFQLSYEYNGNDLRDAHIMPLFAKTGKPKGQFSIQFDGDPYEPAAAPAQFAPVAKIRFAFSGSWKPFSTKTAFSFRGGVYAWGNGHMGVVVDAAEKDMVYVDHNLLQRKLCPMLKHSIPPVPKAPERKFYSLTILFPRGIAKVAPASVKRMYEWVWGGGDEPGWPRATREKVARGEITLTIDGYASRPGGDWRNFGLSERRAKNAKNELMRILGSTGANIYAQPHGEWKQNLPGLLNVIGWLSRSVDPNKFDQAAVIRFEDLE